MAQWVGALSVPRTKRVTGPIPGQAHDRPSYRFSPWLYGRQLTNVSHISSSSSIAILPPNPLPFSLKSVYVSSGEDEEKKSDTFLGDVGDTLKANLSLIFKSWEFNQNLH